MKPAPLRHPQLLNPPSICPQCGNKAWERTSPDDAGEVMVLLVGLHNPRSNVPPYLERGFRQDRFRELEDITDQFVNGEESWFWRRPPRKKGSKGRRYLSTNQAWMALRRENNQPTEQ